MITAFSWGYAGWGQSVSQLLQMTAELEHHRGFAPPLFVDIRLERTGRAPGFIGDRFERSADEAQYKWMPELGNLGVADHGPMRLAKPAAVTDLLDLLERRAAHRQRVIFFCACGSPERLSPANPCHRTLVRRRLLALAKRRGRRITIDEWPGGTRQHIRVAVTRAQLRKARASKASGDQPAPLMTLSRRVDLLRFGELGHFSLGLLHSENDIALAVVGPPVRRVRGWCLPIYKTFTAAGLLPAQRWARDRRALLHLPRHHWPAANGRAATDLAPFALYTIRHPRELDEMTTAHTPAHLIQRRPWRTARELLALARTFGVRIPVLLADATDCRRLTHVGVLDDLGFQRGATRLVVSNTQRLTRTRAPQHLTLLSTKRTIGSGFIRPYAIVATPPFARQQLVQGGHP